MKKLLLATLLLQQLGASTIEKSGDTLLLLLPATALATTFYHDDAQGRMQFYKGAGTNLATTLALKYAIDKTRPDGSDNNSFPSGHTSVTFQAASFIHRRYGVAYGLPAYALATYTGYTRIQADKHYLTDVLAGATIGLLSSYAFTTANGVHYAPIMIEGRYGVGLSKAW